MSKQIADDAPTAALRYIRPTPKQTFPGPPVHQVIPTPVTHPDTFSHAPPKRAPRVIKLVLNSAKALSTSALSATFRVDLPAIGTLKDGACVRVQSMAIATNVAANSVVNVAIDGIYVKDSFYSDGSYAPLQFVISAASTDFTGWTIAPSQISNLDCLRNNVLTVRITSDSSSFPALTNVFHIVLHIEDENVG